MGIRAAVNYKKFTNNNNNEYYIQHVGIGIGNIIQKKHKKTMKNWANIDHNCHRIIHIPKENIQSTQFEFLHEKQTKSTIRVILRSSDDAKYGYNKNNPKIIYQYTPRQFNNTTLQSPTNTCLINSNATQPSQITSTSTYHKHTPQTHQRPTYYIPYPTISRLSSTNNIFHGHFYQNRPSPRNSRKRLRDTTIINLNHNKPKKQKIAVHTIIPFTLTPISKQ